MFFWYRVRNIEKRLNEIDEQDSEYREWSDDVVAKLNKRIDELEAANEELEAANEELNEHM